MNFLDEFCDELNRLRNTPTSYIPALEERRNCMTDGVIKVEADKKIQTVEGEEAITEAIDFLEKVSPMDQQVKFNPALCILSQIYAHNGNAQAFVEENGLSDVEYFSYSEISKDNCCGDFDRPADIILDLLIDDGNHSRINRGNLFSDTLTNIGLVFNKECNRLFIAYFAEFTPTNTIQKLGGNMSINNLYDEIQDCRAGLTNKDKHGDKRKERKRKKDKKSSLANRAAAKVGEFISELGNAVKGESEDEDEDEDEYISGDKSSEEEKDSKKKKHRKHHHKKHHHGKKHKDHKKGHQRSDSLSEETPNNNRRPSEFVHQMHGDDSEDADGAAAFEESYESDKSSSTGKFNSPYALSKILYIRYRNRSYSYI